jgi:hypothetical protein
MISNILEHLEQLVSDGGLDVTAGLDMTHFAEHLGSIGIDVSGLSPAEISALADAYQQSGLSEAAGAHDTKFGANTAPKSDLIIARDGSGYKYVSDFVKGTNPYKPT